MIEKLHETKTLAIDLVKQQQKTLHDLLPLFDDTWEFICQQLSKTPLPIIVMGLGKSGHIGHKIAATLASTGSRAYYIHATEAGHGDLGNIQPSSHVILLSFSGETSEIIDLIPCLKRLQCTTYAITNHTQNTLARSVTHCLHLPPINEACPHDLAPTISTTSMLVIGDALAISLMHLKGFTKNHFAQNHPSGLLGRKLCLRVTDIMRPATELPLTSTSSLLSHALIEMSAKNVGCILVTDSKLHLKGIITDGDLRRCLSKPLDIHATTLTTIMNPSPYSISPDLLAINALKEMQLKQITALPVVNNDILVGLCHLHDLLKYGLN